MLLPLVITRPMSIQIFKFNTFTYFRVYFYQVFPAVIVTWCIIEFPKQKCPGDESAEPNQCLVCYVSSDSRTLDHHLVSMATRSTTSPFYVCLCRRMQLPLIKHQLNDTEWDKMEAGDSQTDHESHVWSRLWGFTRFPSTCLMNIVSISTSILQAEGNLLM